MTIDPSNVREIFDQAIDLPANERAAFLAQACRQNDGLLREVERLLSAHDAAGTFFDPLSSVDAGSPPPPGAPASVGPYRVVRELGRGGVGAVYLAIRDDDQYRKRVAIKLLRPGLESDEIVRRFRNERQILASIDHPFIAKLLDGGSTPEGFPYLVIEYVEGQPIDQYCDARRLPIDERLELFCKVCTAVHFAHQNLVVHRDLKPGNILVTPDGVPKLLDFGIAKLLNPEMFSLTAGETRADARMMTPEYASPEQVRGEPITTASDVYSLGVLLYELVTGHLPYRLQGRQLHQLARAICDDAPVRPSTVVDLEEEITGIRGDVQRITAETVSRTREGTPERLRRKLRGDIEHMLLMAMRKEPHLRYASAEQFSDDIRRHHEGLPVRARKGTWTYRSSRFVRRHRVGLGIVALSMASLVTISAVTIRERRRAEQESARAKAVIQFLTSTLSAIDPRLAQGERAHRPADARRGGGAPLHGARPAQP